MVVTIFQIEAGRGWQRQPSRMGSVERRPSGDAGVRRPQALQCFSEPLLGRCLHKLVSVPELRHDRPHLACSKAELAQSGADFCLHIAGRRRRIAATFVQSPNAKMDRIAFTEELSAVQCTVVSGADCDQVLCRMAPAFGARL